MKTSIAVLFAGSLALACGAPHEEQVAGSSDAILGVGDSKEGEFCASVISVAPDMMCGAGLTCVDSRCRRKGEGASCGQTTDCTESTSLVCLSGRCERRSKLGGPCDDKSWCTNSDMVCLEVESSSWWPWGQKGICTMGTGAVHDACVKDAHCMKGFHCVDEGSTSPYRDDKPVSGICRGGWRGDPCDDDDDCNPLPGGEPVRCVYDRKEAKKLCRDGQP